MIPKLHKETLIEAAEIAQKLTRQGYAHEIEETLRRLATTLPAPVPEERETGPYRVGEPEDEDGSSTVLNHTGEAMTADEIVEVLNRLIEHGTEEEHAANARTEQAQADAKKLKALFPLLWHINDHLRTTLDQGVEYSGSTNDVDRLRDALHKLDPSFDLGTDHEGQKIDEAFVEAHSSPQNPTEAKNAP